jgi:hypothetical protein
MENADVSRESGAEHSKRTVCQRAAERRARRGPQDIAEGRVMEEEPTEKTQQAWRAVLR